MVDSSEKQPCQMPLRADGMASSVGERAKERQERSTGQVLFKELGVGQVGVNGQRRLSS